MKVYVVMEKYDQDKWGPYIIAPNRESAEKWAEEKRKRDPGVEIRIEEWKVEECL